MFRFLNLSVGTRGDDFIVTFADPALWGKTDMVRPSFDETPDLVIALGGDDTIHTGGGSDTIFAGHGDDLLNGGMGNDVLWGGKGGDIFQFGINFPSPGAGTVSGGTGHANRDKIMDFEQGVDLIDVSGWWDDNYGSPLSVTARHEGGSTIIMLERLIFPHSEYSPDSYYRSEIELRGVHNLSEADYIM
jgi:hypothetical protein